MTSAKKSFKELAQVLEKEFQSRSDIDPEELKAVLTFIKTNQNEIKKNKNSDHKNILECIFL